MEPTLYSTRQAHRYKSLQMAYQQVIISPILGLSSRYSTLHSNKRPLMYYASSLPYKIFLQATWQTIHTFPPILYHSLSSDLSNLQSATPTPMLQARACVCCVLVGTHLQIWYPLV